MSCPFSGKGTGRPGAVCSPARAALLAGAGAGSSRRAAPPAAPGGARSSEAVLRPASGRHRHAAADAQLFRRVRLSRQEARRADDDAAALDRRGGAHVGGRDRPRLWARICRIEGPDGGSALGLAAVAADHHLRLRRRAVHEGRRGPLRPRRQAAGGARRPAEIQRRSARARAHRRRHLGSGLRRRSAGRVSRGPGARPPVVWRAQIPLGPGRLSARRRPPAKRRAT